MSDEKLAPIHPGEVLLEEFLKPMALSQNRVAIEIGVPARRINEIVLGKRRVSADTALRLGRYFEMSPQFWLGLQMDYDLDIEEDKLGEATGTRSKTVCDGKLKVLKVGTPLRPLFAEKSIPQTLPQSCAGLRFDFLQRKGHRAFI